MIWQHRSVAGTVREHSHSMRFCCNLGKRATLSVFSSAQKHSIKHAMSLLNIGVQQQSLRGLPATKQVHKPLHAQQLNAYLCYGLTWQIAAL